MLKKNLFSERRKCECCGRRRLVGVSASALGAISTASCRLCSVLYAEPLWLVETVLEMNEGQYADWFYELYTFKDGFYHQVKDVIKEQPNEPDTAG